MQLRRENSVEKARKLTEAVLDKLERTQEQKDLGIKGVDQSQELRAPD